VGDPIETVDAPGELDEDAALLLIGGAALEFTVLLAVETGSNAWGSSLAITGAVLFFESEELKG
jgi:hypothetical protein